MLTNKKLMKPNLQKQQFFSRRKFLQTSAMATAAATALASCNKIVESTVNSSNNSNASANPSIVIVGAGVAGLNAAFHLQNAGISSTLYDANKRAGGRMFTAHDLLNPGLTTELGGEFIDSGHYEMRALAKYFGFPFIRSVFTI